MKLGDGFFKPTPQKRLHAINLQQKTTIHESWVGYSMHPRSPTASLSLSPTGVDE